MNKQLFHPKFDYDFTLKKDAERFTRGGKMYKRPCGWDRTALKVVDKFENNIWLGQENLEGEYSVSYHGTQIDNLDGLLSKGFRLDKCKRFLHGQGIYSTPFIEIAEMYAQSFSHKGDKYKFVLQNRINSDKMLTANKDLYFICETSAIRPYGICIRKIGKKYRIKIQSRKGDIYKLDVEETFLISSIKVLCMFNSKSSLEMDKFQLEFDGKVLKESKNLKDYKIVANSLLYIKEK